MIKPGVSNPEYPMLIRIWSDLSLDYRTDAVRLMVQLALKLVTTQLERQQQEVDDVKFNGYPQNTS